MKCTVFLPDLITITIVFFSPGLHGDCDPSWYESGDHCYYIGMKTSIITWSISENECLNMGGHLASIESTSEYNVISGYLMLYSFTINDYAWIGLNDIVTESKWVWSDGTIYNSSVSRWQSGEPENEWYCNYIPCSQDCVALVSDSCERIWWSDRECYGSYYPGRRYFFICKKEAVIISDKTKTEKLDKMETGALTQACDSLWHESGDHCYYVGMKYSIISWDDSKKECLKMSGNLASIESTSEYNTIIGYLMLYSFTINEYAWIGLNDIVTESKWVWSDGTIYNSSVSRWQSGEPENEWYCNYIPCSQDCVALVSDSCERIWWSDRECSGSYYPGRRYFFICKKGSSPTTQYNASTEEVTTLTVTTTGQAARTTQDSMGTGATNETTSGSSTTPVGRVTTRTENGSAMAAISTSTPMTSTQATTTGAILSTTEATTLVESSTSTVLHLTSFTEPQPTIDTKCSCRCSSLLRKGNMTSEELANFVRLLSEELTVNKSTLSSTRRKLTSAPDERPSSVAIGSTFAIVVMCCVFCPILIVDILRCIKCIWN